MIIYYILTFVACLVGSFLGNCLYLKLDKNYYDSYIFMGDENK